MYKVSIFEDYLFSINSKNSDIHIFKNYLEYYKKNTFTREELLNQIEKEKTISNDIALCFYNLLLSLNKLGE